MIIGKINEYEKKIKGIEDENRKNESEIMKLSNASKMILKQLKNNQCSKPMDYNKLKIIENDPFENINQKIIRRNKFCSQKKNKSKKKKEKEKEKKLNKLILK